MIKLVKGQDNVIPVRVTSLMDYSGFSATLEINGSTKTISTLKSPKAKVDFSAAEIERYGDAILGNLTVLDAAGNEHMKMLLQFKMVDTDAEAQSFQKILIVIVSKFEYEWTKKEEVPKDVVRKSDFAGISKAKATINSCQTTVNDILDAVSESES